MKLVKCEICTAMFNIEQGKTSECPFCGSNHYEAIDESGNTLQHSFSADSSVHRTNEQDIQET